MLPFISFQNLDLLSVAVAVAAMGVLGFVVFLQNRRSITNRYFFYLSLAVILWSVTNYAAYQFHSWSTTLWLLRLVMFFAVWFAFAVFRFLYVFPDEERGFPFWHKITLSPLAIITAVVSLTPLVFSRVLELSSTNGASRVANGPGIILFGLTVFILNLGGIFSLLIKTLRTPTQNRSSYQYVLSGLLITLALIIVFNFILPAFFDNPRFIPLGALFIFPFVAFTSYAILRHKLFNIKVAGTGVLVFLLSVVTFSEVILARELSLIVYRSGVFILVLTFGILLIRGVLREVEQRERIQSLANQLAKSNDQLFVANERLKELDKQKTEFVSIASHQLRAPLTAVKGYSSMLLEGTFGELGEKTRDAVDIIFQSSQKLVSTIEDFLNITRIELGKMKYDITEFDFRQLVEGVTKEVAPTVAKKGLDFKLEVAPAPDYRLKADAGKLAQVVNNLIDNAIKYTPAGSIKVGLIKIAGKIRLSVTDTGIGIDKETMPKLFEKFIRAGDANRTNFSGTGLGLYVAKQIVEALGGRIWAESAGRGQGSTFAVEI